MPNGWKATVRLHVKVLSEPSVSRAAMIAAMQAIYRAVGIDVVVASTESLDVNLPQNSALKSLDDLLVGGCAMGSTTAEQDLLFGYRKNAGPHELCIYFVRSTFFPYSGCGAFPNHKPGAVVASGASVWTLAHECGHVLGLNHVAPPAPNRLMTEAGTSYLPPNPPPTLTKPEAATMIASLK
jgi:hypothetical protein